MGFQPNGEGGVEVAAARGQPATRPFGRPKQREMGCEFLQISRKSHRKLEWFFSQAFRDFLTHVL